MIIKGQDGLATKSDNKVLNERSKYAILNTYYPFINKQYPYTGHSSLSIIDKDNGIYIFAGDIPIMKVTSDGTSPNHMDMERASIYLNKVKEMYVNYVSGNKIESNDDFFNLL